jgi:hypothetical protein
MSAPLRGHRRIDQRSLALPEVLKLMEEESEHMTAMRQATPFAGVLEPAERWAIYAYDSGHGADAFPTPPSQNGEG